MSLESVNPTTGETLETFTEHSGEDVTAALAEVDEAYQEWKLTDFGTRASLMIAAGAVLRDRSAEFARLMALEMGKPVREGRAEVEKCAWVCDYYAENAQRFLSAEEARSDAARSYVTFKPLGIILAVMPWNFPFWQVFRFAAPALMAGNTGVLKHASNVPGCALAIESVFAAAGFPENVFRTLLIGKDLVDRVIEDSQVRAVTLTGSTPAGRAVARKAGEMIKKSVLELGGSDPYIVLDDADLDHAVKTCVASRLINSGQSCISAKRFIVTAKLKIEFEQRFVEEMKTKKMGDPLHEDTDIGPQARADLRDDLHRQVEQSISLGAKCLLGGRVPDQPGAYYPPTVLTDVRPGMPAYSEELFGPVAAIIKADSEEHAIHIANDSVFGLGAAIFTRDVERGEQIAANELEAGCCFVNTFVKSDPRLPFGGIKESGYGRELSLFGIREFVNIKTVYVA